MLPLNCKAALIFLLAFFVSASFALTIPIVPSGYVNDYAKLLSSQTVSSLTQTLQQFEQQTSNQIIVVTFPSLEQESLEDFSHRLASQWKVGQKDKNNGVVLLVFKKEHAIRIEVGYGLEGAIPDSLAAQIIETEIVPAFRADDFDKGITAAVMALMQASKNEYKAQTKDTTEDYLLVAGFSLFCFLFGYYIGPLLALWILISSFGMLYGIGLWLLCFIIYVIFYALLPKSIRPASPFAGGIGGKGGFFGGGRNGGGFSGGGGSFGGGGASDRW